MAYLTKLAVPVYEASENNCKGFEISVSEESPAAGFKSVGTYETANMLIQGKALQSFAFPGTVKARYVKVKSMSDHGGNDYCYVKEVQIFGTFKLPEGAKEFTPLNQPEKPAAVSEEAPEEVPAEEPAAETPSEKPSNAEAFTDESAPEKLPEQEASAEKAEEEVEDYPAAQPM